MVSPFLAGESEAQKEISAHTNLYDPTTFVQYGLNPDLYPADKLIQAARKTYDNMGLTVSYQELVTHRNSERIGWSGPGLCYAPYNPFQPLAPAA